jgi:membrane-associated phospholipid phosphatase
MADIFISYSREDIERARQIVHALEDCGWSVFWDRDLLPGSGFRSVIAKELDDARCVLVLWSHVSVTSDWVIDEAETGKTRGQLVSVFIDDVTLPLGLRQVQAASLTGWQGDIEDPEFALLLRGVRSLIPLAGNANPASPVLAPLPPPTPDPEPAPAPLPRGSSTGLLTRHPALEPTALLGVVFLCNYLETSVDALLTPSSLGADAGYPIADAFRWFERHLTFEAHDTVGAVASVGNSLSYFVILPLICACVVWTLAHRKDLAPYQTVSLGVAINYLISLPFFLFFPVPERWAFPQSEAMLLSDKLSDRLIEIVRPISGLDNSFPSFHVSLTTLVVTACFLFKVPLRWCILALGVTIVLATFVLGIHWIPDMLAGVGIGLTSIFLACRLMRRGGFLFQSRAPAGAH